MEEVIVSRIIHKCDEVTDIEARRIVLGICGCLASGLASSPTARYLTNSVGELFGASW